MLDIPDAYKIADLKGRRPGQARVSPPAPEPEAFGDDRHRRFHSRAAMVICGASVLCEFVAACALAVLELD